MTNIRPISDLRNYSEVLSSINSGSPLFLTKNGRGKFAVLDIEEYKKMQASLQLFSALSEGEQSANEQGWYSLSDLQTLVA